MQLNPLFATAALALAATLSFTPNALARPAQPSSADSRAVHDYTLTEGFLKKWETVSADPNAPVCNLLTLNLESDSLDESVAEYDARPGNNEYLAEHGLTSRDMILGTGTMLAAAMQQVQDSHPDLIEGGEEMRVSKQNMAFYESHKDEVHKIMQKAGKARMHRDHGKTPDCAM